MNSLYLCFQYLILYSVNHLDQDVSVTRNGVTNDLQLVKQQDIMIDSSISQSRHVDGERALERWVPDEDGPECPELESIFDGHWNRLSPLCLFLIFHLRKCCSGFETFVR